ncbi:MAG: hypothetical protein B6U78_00605 [Candidatus Aenigmarchaeota archaeon ex4484_224]|nr:MAG: hypothetical protein B6U78_00605 [Candidatus Aenigmarchaeota archaeon ex4484_224]
MASWVLIDECLAPQRFIVINFKGKDPFNAYRVTQQILRETLQIGSSKYYELEFRWDITTDPREFFIRVSAEKPFAWRTKGVFEVMMHGYQPSDKNNPNGRLTLKISSKLVTEYKLNTAFQKTKFYKALLHMYNFLFLYRVRRKHLDACRKLTFEIERKFREVLGI